MASASVEINADFVVVEGDVYLLRGDLRRCDFDWIKDAHGVAGCNKFIRTSVECTERTVMEIVETDREFGWVIDERKKVQASEWLAVE